MGERNLGRSMRPNRHKYGLALFSGNLNITRTIGVNSYTFART